MDITSLGTTIAAVVGVLVVALAAVVPNILDWDPSPTPARAPGA